MLRKNFFKLICLVLVLCTGLSFFVFDNNAKDVMADVSDISYNDLNTYLSSIDDFSNDYTSGSIPTEFCLRDDYIIYTTNQSAYGLCWAFTTSNAIATTTMKATGEYYDFSEGWIAEIFNYASHNSSNASTIYALTGSSKYYVGGGGNFVSYDYLARKVGMVLESDFTYDEFQNICDENVDIAYDFYSQYLNTTIMENLVPGEFNITSYRNGNTSVFNSMKAHIMNHGGLYAAMRWGTTDNGVGTKTVNGKEITYKLADTSSSSGHAVTIIGWEDNININGSYGAWIVLNSWADSFGDNGIFYVSYDDTDINSLYGYKYVENKTGLYYNAELTESTASYTTNFDGAYYNTFSTTSTETKQKNIFYQDNMEEVDGSKVYTLNYNYSISSGAGIENIKIYRFDNDVTKLFTINTSTSRKLTITGKNLDTGTYKIITTYSNASETEERLNVFYVLDGAEVGSVEYYFASIDDGSMYLSGDEGVIYNNGIYGNYLEYNQASSDIVLGTSNTTGSVVLWLQFSCYSDVTGIAYSSYDLISYLKFYTTNVDSVRAVQITYDLSQFVDYEFAITKSSGESEVIYVHFLKASTSDQMVHISYDIDGGENNEDNFNRALFSSSKPAKIYAPTRLGYEFKGWYTDATFKKALAKESDYYLLKYSDVTIVSSPTVDSSVQTYFDTYYNKLVYVYLYAKWEKQITKVTYHFNNGDSDQVVNIEAGDIITAPTGFSKEGYTFVAWYTDSNFTTRWDFSNPVNTSIHLYAKWRVNIYTIVINYNNGAESTQTTINHGEKLSEPIVTKAGYTLIGWYTDGQFVNKWNFNTAVTTDLAIYAKWQLNNPTAVSITSDSHTYETATNFTINLTYEHAIKNKLSVSVKWYRNNELISGQNGLSLTEKLFIAGTYEYRAVLVLTHDGNTIEVDNNTITINLTQKDIKITNIVYAGNGVISWEDADAVASYKVYLLKIGTSGYVYESSMLTSKSVNVWSYITSGGAYSLIIEKYIDSELLGSIDSETFNIYEVRFETYITPAPATHKSIIVDYGDSVSEPTSPYKEGYVFDGWYLDSAKTNSCEFPIIVTGNIVIYANYSIEGLDIEEIEGLETTYNKDQFVTTSVVVLGDKQGTYSYAWYKVVDDEPVDIKIYKNEFMAKYVSESGMYFCAVTLIDENGFSVTTRSNMFAVNIYKAETEISVTDIQKHYTYNGKEQVVGGTAKLTRQDEVVTLEYRNNSFVDVPVGGILVLEVFAPASDNYNEKSVFVDIVVNKAQGTIEAEEYQSFKYIGREITPTYTLNNNEQTVECVYGTQLKNVGVYEGVVLASVESRNYLSASTEVKIEILQATIEIRANNVTSIWLLPKQELTYQISGEYYGEEINVTLICDVDVSKLGDYTISVKIDNPNYKVRLITGTYTVTAVPYLIAILAIIIVVTIFIAINSKKKFYIEFNENGGSLIKPIETKNKNELRLASPTRQGYQFKGWYEDSELTKPYNSSKVKKGKTVSLYAKWEKSTVITAKEARENQVDQILRDLNIKPTVSQTTAKPIARTEVKHVKEEPKQKTQAEIMQELINKVSSPSSNQNINSDEMKNIINHLTKKD